jgi:CHAT domain-containing protein
LALGDPVYRGDDPRLPTARPGPAGGAPVRPVGPRGDVPSGSFDRLPATGDEVGRLGALMGTDPAEVLVGPAATEGAVKRLSRDGALARFRYLHFACHGVLGRAGGTPPALVLTLAGDPGGEDGALTTEEVTGLALNADLVTLSACQTGQGRESRAEGVSGLARAFLFAGARAVICSLWRVDDAATADLMADLYAGLKGGRPAADALREARLRRIAAGEPPLHWAPFVLIGE